MKKTLAALAVAGMMSPCILFAQQADTASAEHGEANAGYHSQMNAGMTDANKKKTHHHHKKTSTSDSTANGTSSTMNSGSSTNGANTDNTSTTPK